MYTFFHLRLHFCYFHFVSSLAVLFGSLGDFFLFFYFFSCNLIRNVSKLFLTWGWARATLYMSISDWCNIFFFLHSRLVGESHRGLRMYVCTLLGTGTSTSSSNCSLSPLYVTFAVVLYLIFDGSFRVIIVRACGFICCLSFLVPVWLGWAGLGCRWGGGGGGYVYYGCLPMRVCSSSAIQICIGKRKLHIASCRDTPPPAPLDIIPEFQVFSCPSILLVLFGGRIESRDLGVTVLCLALSSRDMVRVGAASLIGQLFLSAALFALINDFGACACIPILMAGSRWRHRFVP